ncbi:glycosyltransferase family 9 protein [Sulfuriroseicoccus oceanibius]|uniref:Glycosyltransferase family 9 protein n=1 Tax=Sulfuriroseicoccus oceanibius TaxID=2707525 RepID=A0A6B3LDQ4_9BACT|nr:glycosyltransferase family 9 protein [Sulfuriroseicoccus oceanibius]QQL45711.1 glycosyltransferase family 9 protein [Sulfuriroseicoccus oceanibius]
MNLLIVQLKRIGDTILTAPAIDRIRQAYPDARITLVLHGPSGQLAPLIPQVDETLVYQPGASNGALWRKILTRRWHVVCDFTGTDRSALMTALSRGTLRISYERYRKSAVKRWIYPHGVDASVRDLSTVDFHLALADAVAAHGQAAATSENGGSPLKLDHQIDLDQPLPKPYAVLHPGTARDEKYWTTENWLTVAAHLHERGLNLVVTGSNDDREQSHLAPIFDRLLDAAIPFTNLSGKLSLADTARVIGDAALVVTVDSAAMHLAAQFGCRQIGLFGPTNPYHWAPTHANARIILASAPDRVTSTFEPKHKKAAMDQIPATTVTTAADELLG